MKLRRRFIAVLIIFSLILTLCGSILEKALPIAGNQVVKAASKKADGSKDEFFLSETASFKNTLADGVYCVPVNVLGGSEYTNEEILDMIDTKDPEY